MTTADNASPRSLLASASVALAGILGLDFSLQLVHGAIVASASENMHWYDSSVAITIGACVALAFMVGFALVAQWCKAGAQASRIGSGMTAIYAAISCGKHVTTLITYPWTEGTSPFMHLILGKAIICGFTVIAYALICWLREGASDRELVRSGITVLAMLTLLDFVVTYWEALRIGSGFTQPDVMFLAAVTAVLAFVAMPRRHWRIAFGMAAVLAVSRAVEFWIRSFASESRVGSGAIYQTVDAWAYTVAAAVFAVAWAGACAIRVVISRRAQRG